MKKVLCSAEKSSVIWAEPHSKSSAEQFGRTERSVYHYITGIRHSISLNIKTAFYLRNDPIIYKGPVDEDIFKTWMFQPSQRKSDLCLVGTANKINGIETDIVVHITPTKCSFCKVSSEDPVIISRAKAMLIVSTYRGSTCEKCKKSASQQTLDSLADSSCAISLKSSQLTLISERIRR